MGPAERANLPGTEDLCYNGYTSEYHIATSFRFLRPLTSPLDSHATFATRSGEFN